MEPAGENVTPRQELDAWLAEADALHAKRRWDEAEALYRRILTRDPRHAEAWHLFGLLAHQRGNPGAAIDRIGRALAIDGQSPISSPTYYVNRGVALHAAGFFEAAVEHFMAALKLRPDLAEAHLNLGNALTRQRKLSDAADHYRRAVSLAPQLAEAHFNLGLVQQALGQSDAAAQSFRRTLALRPDRADAYYHLSRCRKVTTEGRELVQEVQGLLAQPNLPEADATSCHFALGKIHDDLGEYAEAFRHYDAANRLERTNASFDRGAHSHSVDATIKTFTRDFFHAHADFGSASNRPVFIVGMPRSGTTLVEQILASHSRVFGAGELEFWLRQREEADGPDAAAPDRSRIAALAARYLTLLEGLSGSAEFVTDKMPHNFLRLGLIHLAFPRARIIHCIRNPADTCLSIFFHKFTRAHGYATDLDDLAFYYGEYRRLMDHWRRALPGGILHEVRYEELVSTPEANIRALLATLGLAWEDACLDFHRSERRAATPSDDQVRQPIYRDSLARWRNYLPYIAPLLPLSEAYERERS